MAGCDCKCPYCDTVLDVMSAWNYQTEFGMYCECGKSVEVRVAQVPEFSTHKPVCQKCNRAEPVNAWYCQKCQDELNALSAHLGSKS